MLSTECPKIPHGLLPIGYVAAALRGASPWGGWRGAPCPGCACCTDTQRPAENI